MRVRVRMRLRLLPPSVIVQPSARRRLREHRVEHIGREYVRHLVVSHVLVAHVNVQKHHVVVFAVRHGRLERHLVRLSGRWGEIVTLIARIKYFIPVQ